MADHDILGDPPVEEVFTHHRKVVAEEHGYSNTIYHQGRLKLKQALSRILILRRILEIERSGCKLLEAGK